MQYIRIDPNAKKTKRDVIDFFKVIIAIQFLILGLSYITGQTIFFVEALIILGVYAIYGFIVLHFKIFKKNPSESDIHKSLATLSIGYSVLCSLGFALSFSKSIIVFVIMLIIMGLVLVFEYFIIKKVYIRRITKASGSQKDDPLNNVMLITLTALGAAFGVLYPHKDITLILVLVYFLFTVIFAFGYSNIMKAKELSNTGDGSVSCSDLS